MRPEKKAITEEIKGKLEQCGFVLLTNHSGLSVEQMAALRRNLREAGSQLMVVKNSFLTHAAADAGMAGLQGLVDGPTSMIVGEGDVSAVAKMLRDFAKEHGVPSLRGGYLESEVLSAEDVQQIANLPAREVLLGKLVGTIAAPMTQAVAVLNQKVLSLLYVLKAVEEKKGADNN